ncbi:putative oxidoreductase, chloroplastic isoform C [Glycine soja]|uniref:Putative oxidoreductase, chloroplastic isoform C n=1 Tax=Glycine soja TaxID=3848 RepID=A0A445FRW7_GLYSO|nr:putative oxidoreductase, chloroplastic isoform C [Glycine soja]
MALHISSGCFTVMCNSRVHRIRAVASEGSATLNTVVEEKVKLGGSDLKVSGVGIGAWSWGDTTYWNNFEWNDRNEKAARAAFNTSIDGGLTFFDTAEVYGSGLALGAINSEVLLGRYIKERKEKDPEVEIEVATKFAALPWRFGRQSVLNALKDSLCRLGLTSVDLYQLHWPGVWGNEGYIDGLGDAVEKGLVKAVGVSNYSGNSLLLLSVLKSSILCKTMYQFYREKEKRLREAYEKLKKRGIPLATNQVNYSLIYRAPEENGVKAACDELGITIIAYSPIAQGALTGKYTPDKPPSGPRGRIYTPEFLTKLQPLLNKISEIGEKYDKTPTQVSLNWLVAQGNVVPIPGAKTAEQAEEFRGALGWRLTDEEVPELRSVASEIKPVIGFPVEKL